MNQAPKHLRSDLEDDGRRDSDVSRIQRDFIHKLMVIDHALSRGILNVGGFARSLGCNERTVTRHCWLLARLLGVGIKKEEVGGIVYKGYDRRARLFRPSRSIEDPQELIPSVVPVVEACREFAMRTLKGDEGMEEMARYLAVACEEFLVEADRGHA